MRHRATRTVCIALLTCSAAINTACTILASKRAADTPLRSEQSLAEALKRKRLDDAVAIYLRSHGEITVTTKCRLYHELGDRRRALITSTGDAAIEAIEKHDALSSADLKKQATTVAAVGGLRACSSDRAIGQSFDRLNGLSEKLLLLGFDHMVTEFLATSDLDVPAFIRDGHGDVSVRDLAKSALQNLSLNKYPLPLTLRFLNKNYGRLPSDDADTALFAAINSQLQKDADASTRWRTLSTLLGQTEGGSGAIAKPLLSVWVIVPDDVDIADKPKAPTAMPLGVSWRQVHLDDISAITVASPYQLFLDSREREVERRIVDKQTKKSERAIGTRLVPNPMYDQLLIAISQSKSDLERARYLAATSPPGFAQSYAQGQVIGLSNRISDLYDQLRVTPRQREEPVYEVYSYHLNSLALNIKSPIKGWIIESKTGWMGTVSLTHRHEKVAAYSQGIDPNDRYLTLPPSLQDVIDEAALGAFSLSVREVLQEKVQLTKRSNNWPSVIASSAGKARNARQSAYSSNVNHLAFPYDKSVVIVSVGNSLGAGFYLARNLIITNAHVVQGTGPVEIRSKDGNIGRATVKRADYGLDLALLSTDLSGAPVTLARGDKVELGAEVFAVGHPKGLEFSVTRGSIGAVRSWDDEAGNRFLVIQTDAPINAGNSGGPLFRDGQVVGINTIKLVGEGIEGMGFSVHVDEIRKFAGLKNR
jgi:S1-C subfamily serine protease